MYYTGWKLKIRKNWIIIYRALNRTNPKLLVFMWKSLTCKIPQKIDRYLLTYWQSEVQGVQIRPRYRPHSLIRYLWLESRHCHTPRSKHSQTTKYNFRYTQTDIYRGCRGGGTRRGQEDVNIFWPGQRGLIVLPTPDITPPPYNLCNYRYNHTVFIMYVCILMITLGSKVKCYHPRVRR